MSNTDAVIEALERHYLFAPLSAELKRQLAETTRIIRLRTGEILFRRGDEAARFFLVGDGQIKLFRVSPDGHEKVVEIIGPDETFAEAVMFMRYGRYPVSAEAVAPTMLYGIANSTYLDVLRSDSEACLQLLGDLSQRLHRRLNEIDTLTLQRARDRVVRYLIDHLPAGDQPVIELPAAKHIVASRLAIQPETFSRIMLQLSQEGVIKVTGRSIEILQADALREHIHD